MECQQRAPDAPLVLQLTNSFQEGGTERQVVQLTRLLQQSARYQPWIACLDGSGALRPEAERLQLGEIAEFPLTSFYDRNAARQLRRMVRYLRERQVAVLHTHDFYTNVIGMAAATLARVPARVASRRDIAGFRSHAQSLVERCSFHLAHAVVANAEAVRHFLVSTGVPARKIVTVHNGVDMGRIERPAGFTRAAALAALDLPAGRRFVTIVANLESQIKDHGTFLRAARRVRDAVADAAFVIAGEGTLRESLRAYAAELHLGKDVFFIGRCKRMAELLAVSEVCVLTSRSEGFSNAILEYMAAARPVVATDVGGTGEAVVDDETGFLVPPADDVRLAERIKLLLLDPERAQLMGERGQEVVRQKFPREAQLQRIESLYDRLLQPGSRRGPHSRDDLPFRRG